MKIPCLEYFSVLDSKYLTCA